MNTQNRSRVPVVPFFAALLLAALLGPAALAHPKHGHRHHGQRHHDQRHHAHRTHAHYAPQYERVRLAPVPFVVPRHIDRFEQRRLERYFRGSVWYAPHRHRHTVYAFPVRYRGEWIERPHYYCAGTFHEVARVTYSGPRVSIRVGF